MGSPAPAADDASGVDGGAAARGEAEDEAVKARLVLMPDPGEVVPSVLPGNTGTVLVAEVQGVEVELHDSDDRNVHALTPTYLETTTRADADRRLGTEAVGWPLIVYLRPGGP